MFKQSTTQLTVNQQRAVLDIVWALVLLQGGFLVLSAIESFVVNVTQGFLLIVVFVLTSLAAAATLRAARGLREHKRWARRLTLTGEWFVLAVGATELIATQMLDPAGLDLVPLTTSVVVPITVLVLLRRTKALFAVEDQGAHTEQRHHDLEVSA